MTWSHLCQMSLIDIDIPLMIVIRWKRNDVKHETRKEITENIFRYEQNTKKIFYIFSPKTVDCSSIKYIKKK